MLYVSTRNKVDSHTAYHVLHRADLPGEEQYVPMQFPKLTDYQLAALEQMSFGETVAFMFNLFYGIHVNGWNVDFAIGRQAVTLADIGHKVTISENWHNPAGEYNYLLQRLYALACEDKKPTHRANLWFQTVVNISLLFSAHTKLCKNGIYEMDIAVETGDLQGLFAIRYAQKMGLPVARIILGCMEGDNLWEFISYGDFQTGRKEQPSGLEPLLWLAFGDEEVRRYLETVRKRGIYKLNLIQLEMFRNGVFVAVVGDNRAREVAATTLRVTEYCMTVDTARAFGALQDYRAKYGENRPTLMMAKEMSAETGRRSSRRQ